MKTATGAGMPQGLPRLAGVVVGPFGRSAIFAVEGSKPVVATEGSHVGAWLVRSIAGGTVEVTWTGWDPHFAPKLPVIITGGACRRPADCPARRIIPAAMMPMINVRHSRRLARPAAKLAHPHARRARIALLLATALVGCEHPKAPVVTMLPPLPGETATAPLRINGNVGSPQVPAPPLISYGTPPSTAVPAPPEGAAGGDISLDFADTDIREVVTQIMGTILRLNYTIDPAVHGTATLRTQQPLARSQLLPVLQSLLAEDGAALVQAGSLYRIVPIAQAAAAAAAAGTSGTAPVVLRYASAEDLAKVLQPFVGDGGKIAADPAHNILLVSGSPDTRDGLIGLIRSFDVDLLAGHSYALLPVENGGVKDFASALQDAFRAQSGGALAGQVRVIADVAHRCGAGDRRQPKRDRAGAAGLRAWWIGRGA